jgi:hypothetical protein
MNAPAYLTPSEQVYLNGEKFAAKGGVFNKTRLMHIDFAVDTRQLAQAVMAAAFITLQQQGTLRLEFHEKKRILGLGTATVLCADAVGPIAAWPAWTLESMLPGLAQRLAAKGEAQNQVQTMVYAWLEADSAAPFEEVFARVKRGMAARGLLEGREQKVLLVFKTIAYTLPESTRQLALTQALQPIQQLLGWYAQAQPEYWKALNEQIKRGIESRQEKSDD